MGVEQTPKAFWGLFDPQEAKSGGLWDPLFGEINIGKSLGGTGQDGLTLPPTLGHQFKTSLQHVVKFWFWQPTLIPLIGASETTSLTKIGPANPWLENDVGHCAPLPLVVGVLPHHPDVNRYLRRGQFYSTTSETGIKTPKTAGRVNPQCSS